eukprot:365746-Chlamydomonas_euryale.AAC.2
MSHKCGQQLCEGVHAKWGRSGRDPSRRIASGVGSIWRANQARTCGQLIWQSWTRHSCRPYGSQTKAGMDRCREEGGATFVCFKARLLGFEPEPYILSPGAVAAATAGPAQSVAQ